MLLKDHARYHELSPKDVGLKDTTAVQITRTTAETGEQFTFEVPIYPDDSRELLNDRVNFVLSIMQDRLEDVNKAMLEVKAKADKANRARQAIMQVRALEKRRQKGKITEEQFEKEMAELDEKFGDAMENATLEAKSDDEVLSENATA